MQFFYPRGYTPRPSNPVTMTEAYKHNMNIAVPAASMGGQRAGQFASVRSVASLGTVQRVRSAGTGLTPSFISTLLIRDHS